MKFISILESSRIPKYKQLISSIEFAIENKVLSKGDLLPSINSIRKEFTLSRDTVLLAYNELKLRGIVQSVAGKGYYVKSTNVATKQKIFLLFDELNAFKENLYNSFINNLNSNIEVDIYFHHFNSDVFSKTIYNNVGNYNYYIIMPANIEDAHIWIDNLPEEKVIVLDQMHTELLKYSGIYQNFKKDIYESLTKIEQHISNYNKLIIVFSEDKQPLGMLNGFKKYCNENNFNYEVISGMKDREVSKNEIYLIPDDRSLILAIKKIKLKKLNIGNNIGIISYNETLLKEIVADGITTISTDFKYMGERLAEMVTNKEKVKIENPSAVIIRNSL